MSLVTSAAMPRATGIPPYLAPKMVRMCLTSLGEVQGPYSSTNTVALDILVALALGVGFKLVHAILLIIKARRASKVLPPRKKEAKSVSQTSHVEGAIETSVPEPEQGP